MRSLVIDSVNGFAKLFAADQFHLARTLLDTFGRIISEGKPYSFRNRGECESEYIAFAFIANFELRTIVVRKTGSKEDILQAARDFCDPVGTPGEGKVYSSQRKEISWASYIGMMIFAIVSGESGHS